MKITKQRLKEIIREELVEAVLDYNKATGKYGRSRSSKWKLPPLDPEKERRERERQDALYRRHRSKRLGDPGMHLEEDGGKPLPNTRVQHRESGKKGYKTSRDLHGDKNYVMVKWDAVKGQSRVEKHLLDILKE